MILAVVCRFLTLLLLKIPTVAPFYVGFFAYTAFFYLTHEFSIGFRSELFLGRSNIYGTLFDHFISSGEKKGVNIEMYGYKRDGRWGVLILLPQLLTIYFQIIFHFIIFKLNINKTYIYTECIK